MIGGTSAEANLKAVKLASTGAYDELPTEGNELGQAFRDLEWEAKIQKSAKKVKSELSLVASTSLMMLKLSDYLDTLHHALLA